MPSPVIVALVDSGLTEAQAGLALHARSFRDEGQTTEVVPDLIGHGGMLAGLVLDYAPTARFLNAQVFHRRPVTTAGRAALAIEWAIDHGADIILLSLGLREDRAALAQACAKAVAAGAVPVASTPPRGQMVFPAAYPGMVRAAGDARCGAQDVSWFDGRFGACPRAMGDSGPAGSSFAAGRVAGMLAMHVTRGLPAAEAVAALRQSARFVGRERRMI